MADTYTVTRTTTIQAPPDVVRESMDATIGPDVERGLAALETVNERAP